MLRAAPVDGFRLAYERAGSGPPVVLLHGWPGDHRDYAAVVPLLTGEADVVVPTCADSGCSDKHVRPPAEAYSAAAQARSVLGLIDELALERPVIGGYDIGSRIAQAIARDAPEAVRALVVSPPLPGAGERVLTAEAQREFWYQAFHQLVAGRGGARRRPCGGAGLPRALLGPLVGPGLRPRGGAPRRARRGLRAAGRADRLDRLVPGRVGDRGDVAGRDAHRPERIATPTTVLWQEHDPLFPREWADRIDAYFSAAELEEARRRRSLHPTLGAGGVRRRDQGAMFWLTRKQVVGVVAALDLQRAGRSCRRSWRARGPRPRRASSCSRTPPPAEYGCSASWYAFAQALIDSAFAGVGVDADDHLPVARPAVRQRGGVRVDPRGRAVDRVEVHRRVPGSACARRMLDVDARSPRRSARRRSRSSSTTACRAGRAGRTRSAARGTASRRRRRAGGPNSRDRARDASSAWSRRPV